MEVAHDDEPVEVEQGWFRQLVVMLLMASCADSPPAQKRSADPPSRRRWGRAPPGSRLKRPTRSTPAFGRKTRGPSRQLLGRGLQEKTQDRTLQGDLSIGFTVTPSGALKDVKLIKSSMGNAEVDSCVASTAAKWNFPTVSAELPYVGRIHLGAQF